MSNKLAIMDSDNQENYKLYNHSSPFTRICLINETFVTIFKL
jgi:hypothetical protein